MQHLNILDALKKDIKAIYKRLSNNDVKWAEPKSYSHQGGIDIPKGAIDLTVFLPITRNDIEINNRYFTVIEEKLNIHWVNYIGIEIFKVSKLKYYKSKNSLRITQCPSNLFYPNIPDYMILLKYNQTQKYILFLGKFNDNFFLELCDKYQIKDSTRMTIIKN